jgi:RND family efflux transporter MFP subunit
MKRTHVLSAIILAAIIIAACKRDYNAQYEKTKDVQKIPVSIQKLEPVNDPIPIESSGILGSQAEVKLSFKIGGIIQDIKVEEGQFVRKGQVLASLNMVEINAKVNQATNAVRKAQRDLARAENLYRDSVITLEQLQDLQTVSEVSKSDLEIAQFNQRFSQIQAPESGKILRRFAEEGELVNGGTPVFVFGNSNSRGFVMRIGVADKDIVRIQYRDSAEIYFDAYPNHIFTAKVTEVAETADQATGAFEIELTLDHTDRILKNGFIGKVKVYPSIQDPYYRIDMTALVSGKKNNAKIYVLDQSTETAIGVEVAPIHIDDGFFTIRANELRPGHVITEGAAYLSNGQQVSVNNQIL